MLAKDLGAAQTLIQRHTNATRQLARLGVGTTILVRGDGVNALEISGGSELGQQMRALARRHLEATLADLYRQAAQIGLVLPKPTEN
jgi:hypothetical protein